MPCLNLSTNVNLDGVDTSSILSEATSSVASIIGKPEAADAGIEFNYSVHPGVIQIVSSGLLFVPKKFLSSGFKLKFSKWVWGFSWHLKKDN
ncbi:hypothetical protein Pint_34964 [Pistacia integerrima]|uniref:Uncharacterized protein n=1 Tax=Pistacia integerrima TaxID=434235 RepID=A0ACC0Y121_9ROSI|nr:hypothetical protein Pint_34964 [Pistacia integerrima]